MADLAGAAAGTGGVNALGREILAEIDRDGPIDVARFMSLALFHPRLGYYTTKEPFGANGDFITAPEISQVFGELIGLWAADFWQRAGAPPTVALVELGPGRGTLMADALRAARALPAFRAAVSAHLVEASPRLAEVQRTRLSDEGATWHTDLATLPDLPLIVVANEFFDALPIRQFERRPDGWHERLIGRAGTGLAFGLSPLVSQIDHPADIVARAPAGAVVETCAQAGAVIAALAARLKAQGGVVLAIDYGAPASGTGDTLQAVSRHQRHDPLTDPGQADLTAHVDFGALARAAMGSGLVVHGPVAQSDFLTRLGLAARAAALTRANPARQAEIAQACARLTAAEAMGRLFQAIAFTDDGAPAPAGF